MSQTLIDTNAPATGNRFGMGGPSLFQATVVGDGAVTASVVIETTNDGLAWYALMNLDTSGTGTSTVANITEHPWDACRARVTAVTGTNARVIVTFNTRGRV